MASKRDLLTKEFRAEYIRVPKHIYFNDDIKEVEKLFGYANGLIDEARYYIEEAIEIAEKNLEVKEERHIYDDSDPMHDLLNDLEELQELYDEIFDEEKLDKVSEFIFNVKEIQDTVQEFVPNA